MLTPEQKQTILLAMEPYMKLDKYGRTTIRNIYFDTDNYLLIRRSIDKPEYKEKLRIRSYGKAFPDSTVFVELKKKYRNVVYKRRLSLPVCPAMEWVCGTQCPDGTAMPARAVNPAYIARAAQTPGSAQIAKEIDYFLTHYENLRPAVFLSYAREAYYSKDKSDFRVTFDDTVLCRQNDLSLESEIYGTPLLPDGKVLMELKCSGGIPLWMTHVLSAEHIYKTSFSKYGTAYQSMIFPELQNIKPHNFKEEALHA